MEGIARVDAQPRNRTNDEEFTDAVAPHYAALVRRLTLVVGDLHGGQDLAQETYLRACLLRERRLPVDRCLPVRQRPGVRLTQRKSLARSALRLAGRKIPM